MLQIEPPEDIQVPQSLLPPERVEELVAERNPHFVPLERFGPSSSAMPPPDPATGVPLPFEFAVHLQITAPPKCLRPCVLFCTA